MPRPPSPTRIQTDPLPAATLDASTYVAEGEGLTYEISYVVHPVIDVSVVEDGLTITRSMEKPTIKSITDDGAGVFTIAIRDDAGYTASEVGLLVTDETGLWSEQAFLVRRNKAPVPVNIPRANLSVHLGTAARASMQMDISGVFTDDDMIEVYEQFNSHPFGRLDRARQLAGRAEHRVWRCGRNRSDTQGVGRR